MKKTIFLLPLILIACTTTTQKTPEQTEMETYATFEADLACELAKAGIQEDENAVFQVLAATEERAGDYGYTMDDVQALSLKYRENEEFITIAQQKMRETCPETVAELEASS